MKLPKLTKIKAKVKDAFNTTLAKISLMISIPLMTVTANAEYDFDSLVDQGQTAEEAAGNFETVLKIAFGLVKAVAVVAGLLLVYQGIMRVKKANEPNSQTSIGQGLMFIVLGGCLGALPFIFLTSTTIIQG